MEYTERKGKYYIQGIMRVEKTPDGWTLFKRVSPVANEYYPIQGEHFDNVNIALEKADEIVRHMEL